VAKASPYIAHEGESVKRIAVLLAVLFVVASAVAAAPETHKILFIRAGKLIYDADKPPIEAAEMIVIDGKVTAVGKNLEVPAGAEQLDFSHYTVLPGLVDAHIHLWTGPRAASPSVPLAALRASKAMSYALNSGVVAVRVLGSNGFIDVALANAIDEGVIPGPHIIPAGHAISIIGGHGDLWTYPSDSPFGEYYTPLHGFVNSPADAEQAVHLQVKYGAKVIKILASGGVGSPLDSPSAEQVSPEEMRVIVQQAHMDHIKVAAHVENLMTTLDALHAGVDSIEHGSELDQEAVDFMKSHNIVFVPTVYIVDNILMNGEKDQLPDFMLRKARELAVKHFPSFQLGVHNGLIIAAGSDMSYEPGKGTVLDEVITEVKYGMTPQQALVAGTKHSAELLGLNLLGTLETGKEASFIAVEGDPLSDIKTLKSVKAVVFQGKVVVALTH
jgi:imidazolonepropionase-like amidohydrolase